MSGERNFSFRRYEPQDFPQYKHLFEAVYSYKLDEEFFNWKNLQNPSRPGEPLIYLVFDGEKLIGANSFFPATVLAKGGEYLAVQSGDTMVDNDYRGQGLFKKILQFAIEDLRLSGYSLIFGFANSNSYPGFQRLGFSTLSKVDIYYKLVNFKQALGTKGSLAAAIGSAIDSLAKLLLNPGSNYSIAAEDNQELEQYFASAPAYFTLKKNKPYLVWKYQQKPESAYRTIVLRKHGEIAAAFVIRQDKHGSYTMGDVVEYFIPDQRETKKATRYLVHYLRTAGAGTADYLKIWGSPAKNLLKPYEGNLFFKRPVDLYFIVKLLDEKQGFLLNPDDWHVVSGDSDTA